jgi:hypothetical protein
MKLSRLTTLCIAVLLSLLVATPAMAYLDPSTGNFILQSLIAGAFGAYLFFKMNMKALRDRIQGWRGNSKPESPSDDAASSDD